MTKLVEIVRIEIEIDGEGSALERAPRDQLRILWPSIGHIVDTAKGKWAISGPGVLCRITNQGLEEIPEEGGGDN
jgi:hypothetical protein